MEGVAYMENTAYFEEYRRWLSSSALTEEERAELSALDDNEIKERFFAPLSFGTAGLRSTMGLGAGLMNRFTVGQATQGLADALLELQKGHKGVVIAYDCRIGSPEFAKLAAEILAGNNIPVLLFDGMRPTPLLSFALLRRGCAAGINITASHNPKEYNGYKVYSEDGAQLSDENVALVSAKIRETDLFTGVKCMDFDRAVRKGWITLIGAEDDEAFMEAVLSNRLRPEATESSDLRVVYTPFHGTGASFVPQVLERAGLSHVFCQEEQMKPDGTFPSVKSPNPEEKESFALAIELAREKDVDLIIGTDPDADRVGIVVRDQSGEYVALTGNQTGILLMDYLIRSRQEKGTMPKKPAFVTTIVTSRMAQAVCDYHKIRLAYSFTGFRFIAGITDELEREGYTSLMGYEESYGYLIGSHCRDKDAVTASLLIAEMAAWYDQQGMTLYDAMEKLYETYGYFVDETISVRMPGTNGSAAMAKLMEDLRANPPKEIGGFAVSGVRDYQTGVYRSEGGEEALPLKNSNVLSFELSDGSAFIVRPSGTEPKIKFYLLTKNDSKEEGQAKVARLVEAAKAITQA
jgi:phosphoglucomutase